jgi:hypothetical protein
MLLAIEDVANDKALVDFINGRIEQIDKKASGTSKADEKKNAENEALKTAICDTITDTAMTISEMQKANPELAELSNQKISSMLRQLKEDGEVVRTESKGKAYFKVA